jgi:hypothetical protein
LLNTLSITDPAAGCLLAQELQVGDGLKPPRRASAEPRNASPQYLVRRMPQLIPRTSQERICNDQYFEQMTHSQVEA